MNKPQREKEEISAVFDSDEDGGELIYTYTVDSEGAGKRLDRFVADRSANEATPLSRSQAARLCLEKRVFINGMTDTKNASLSPGDTVTVILPAPEPDRLEPENIPLNIVYEDADIIVVNKPSGMVVHPAPGHSSGTLCSALLYHCGDSLSGIGGVQRPGIVHRIDKDTSGLLVVAKNDLAHTSLAAQIKEHSCFRTYIALTVGCPKSERVFYDASGRIQRTPDGPSPIGKPGDITGTVDLPIGRHPTDRKKMAVVRGEASREAVTHWRLLEEYDGYSMLECRLETGRTHQIRVHLSYLGHPVLGDPLYGGDRNRFCERHPGLTEGQALHAARLELTHPRTGARMLFRCDIPEGMLKAAELLKAEAEG
ncbi:MAG: RluA family pseudouridine synthase [Clostridia bacterium]|nr:RluA family pseudouridine synthase [Clostridia bacterium]